MDELVVVRGPGRGSRFPLNLERWQTDELLVGRSRDCHILLADTRVSKRHSRLVLEDGRWRVEDLRSRNGLFLNGRRVQEALLAPGDELRIGDVFLRFVREEAVAPGEAPTVALGGGAAETGPEAEPVPPPRREGALRLPRQVADKEELREAVASVREVRERIRREIARAIIGQDQVVEDLLVGLLARGHCLLEGVPGLAKTLLVSTLAGVLDLEFKRIQFTPDLMPADITGTEVLEEDPVTRERRYRFIPGPIFANIVLADEINRAPPKTQAALLEAMQEHRVTAAGTSYSLSPPFFVLATQNPIEQEGTYPLPEAQLDRFMLKISVGYPSREEEVEILRATTLERDDEPELVLSAGEMLKLQAFLRRLPASDLVLYYAADLARATRPREGGAPELVERYVAWGAGPRAAQYLTLGAKARALLDGRANVTTADVRSVAHQVLRHRVGLNFHAASEGLASDDIVARLLDAVPDPR